VRVTGEDFEAKRGTLGWVRLVFKKPGESKEIGYSVSEGLVLLQEQCHEGKATGETSRGKGRTS